MTYMIGFVRKLRNKQFVELAIKHRETCHHWIDYEIFDKLDAKLKDIYIEQFSLPEFCLSKSSTEKQYSWTVHCKANHKDAMGMCLCDCSKKFKKTIRKMSKNIPVGPNE